MPAAAFAEGWQTVMTGPITVKTRAKPNNPVKEVWAEGVINAPAVDIQAAILDAEAYPRFMPYFKEAKYLGGPAADGSQLVYSRLALPFVSERDYVVRVMVDKRIAEDGTGEFQNRWTAVPDGAPPKSSVVRLRYNVGMWVVRSSGDGTAKVTYQFSVDPGGWVPSFAADMGNKQGVIETFKAIEKEAKQREVRRKRQAKANQESAVDSAQALAPVRPLGGG
jgi:hypothetical protein